VIRIQTQTTIQI